MRTVLVVDDHEESRYMLQALLQGNGYRVTQAADGLAALESARADRPDLVVSDALMPRMDGFALCRTWVQDPDLGTIPFLFFSATYTRPEDAELGLSLGARQYVVKPQEPEALLAIIASALEGPARPVPAPIVDDTVFRALHEPVLARKIDEKIAELQALNRELEARVAHRTAEIEARNRRLRELAAELTLTEQRERQRLGRTLHDRVQQQIVAAKFHTSCLASRVADPSAAAEVRRIRELLDQMLEASRVLTEEISPPILFDLGLGPALAWLSRQLRDRDGVRVEVSFAPDAEPPTLDLRLFLFDAVRELLLNVVRHAGVRSARVLAERGPEGRIRLAVSDEGKGFESLQHLAEGAGGPGRRGLFGLQQRLEHLGGRLEIDAAPGRGTRVVLWGPPPPATPGRPPRDGRPEPAAPAARAAAPRGGDGRIRVVIADDHPMIRRGLASLLATERDIVVVGEAADGEEAVSVARTTCPHVVVMDVVMDGVDGIEGTRRLRAEMPGVAVLGLSMHELGGEMDHAMHRAGAVGFIAKGSPPEDLAAAIRACLATVEA